MSRVMTCTCGHETTAETDADLFDKVKGHLQADHPERDVVDERLRNRIADEARDAED